MKTSQILQSRGSANSRIHAESSVRMQMVSLLIIHDAVVEFADLRVFFVCAFIFMVALARNYGVGKCIMGFCRAVGVFRLVV